MYANVIAQICSGGTEEVFQRMRDFLCRRSGTYDYSVTGIGWTLHDSSYTTDENNCALNDWFVVTSTGEDGKRRPYYHVKWIAANRLQVDGYLYWNNATHSGTHRYYYSHNIVTSDSSTGTLWLYGDLDHWQTYLKWGTTYYGHYAGLLTNLWYNNEVAETTTSLNAGSEVVIPLDDLPDDDWEIGKKIFILDNTNIELVKIIDRDTILKQITVQTLTNNFTLGAQLCCNASYFLSGHITYYLHTTYAYDRLLVGKDGSTVDGQSRYARPPARPTFVNYMGPDPQNGDYSVAPITISSNANFGYMGCLINMKQINDVNLVNEDVVSDGVNDWRYFSCSGSPLKILTKEV